MTDYQPGDIVNGKVFTGTDWVEVHIRDAEPGLPGDTGDAAPPSGSPAPQPWAPPNPGLPPAGPGSWAQRHRALLIVGVLLAAFLAGGIYLQSSSPRSTSSPATSTDTTYVPIDYTRTVWYEVEGTASAADITMSTPGGTSQASDVDVPMTSKATGARGLRIDMTPGDFAYVSAQNKGESGTITCRISVDGVVISENSSSGAYVIASCDGRVS